MTPRVDPRVAGLGFVLAVLGLVVALAVGAGTEPEVGRQLGGYAIGTLPLAAVIGAFVGRRSRAPLTGSVAAGVGGAALAIAAGCVIAAVLASIRFRYLGSEGVVSLPTLPYARESLMLFGLLPAVAAAGWMVARRPGAGRWPVIAQAILGGASAALLAGPMVLVSGSLSGLPAGPLVLALVVALGAALVPARG